MRLVITILVLGLIAALCSSQPVDSSATQQAEMSTLLRFKREKLNFSKESECPHDFVKIGLICVREDGDNTA